MMVEIDTEIWVNALHVSVVRPGKYAGTEIMFGSLGQSITVQVPLVDVLRKLKAAR